MTDHSNRYQNPDTGEWLDERRSERHLVRGEVIHQRIDAVNESINGKLKALENSMKLWIVCSVSIAIGSIALAFLLPFSDKIYGQATIDTAQDERIVANRMAIADLRQETKSQLTALQNQIDRRFNNLDRMLDKILERTAYIDPRDTRGVILPRENEK